jgi:hypothetical protein
VYKCLLYWLLAVVVFLCFLLVVVNGAVVVQYFRYQLSVIAIALVGSSARIGCLCQLQLNTIAIDLIKSFGFPLYLVFDLFVIKDLVQVDIIKIFPLPCDPLRLFD